jgi:putative membrane protein
LKDDIALGRIRALVAQSVSAEGERMKQDCKNLVGMVAVGLLALAPVFAQQSANRMGSDTSFVTKAAQGGMAEVKLGQLATEKASSPDVKAFGQQMVDDHSKANDELKNLASKKGETLPTDIDAKDQAKYDRLSKMSGAEFDKAYMADMVSDHKTDVSEFRRESQRGTDPDIKAWAAKTLPTLEHHLQMAETTDAKVKK